MSFNDQNSLLYVLSFNGLQRLGHGGGGQQGVRVNSVPNRKAASTLSQRPIWIGMGGFKLRSLEREGSLFSTRRRMYSKPSVHLGEGKHNSGVYIMDSFAE